MTSRPILLSEVRAPSSTTLWLCLISFLYVAISPIYVPSFTPNLYDNARLLEVIALTLLATGVLMSRTCAAACYLVEALPAQIRFALLTLCGLISVSVANSPHWNFAIHEACLAVLLTIVTVIISIGTRTHRGALDKLLIVAFVISIFLFSAIFCVAFVTTVSQGVPFNWFNSFVVFSNVRFFSQYQSYTLPLIVLPLMVFHLPTRWKAVIFLIAAQWWALQFAVGTRAVWFAFGATIVFLLLFARREAKAWFYWQALTFTGGSLLYLIIQTLFLSGAPGLEGVVRRGFTSNERLTLWQAALNMIAESPWLGIGPMHYAFRNFEIAAHPHNSLLQIAAEYGLPAALIVATLAGYLFVRSVGWCKQGSADNRNINVALTASLAMGLADSLVSGNTLMPHSQMALFIVIGWMIGRNTTPDLQIAAVTRWREVVFSLAMVTAIAVVGFGALEYWTQSQADGFQMPEYSHPRFWQNGHWPVR